MGALAATSRRGGPAPGTVERMLAAAPHRGDLTAVVDHGQVSLGVVHRPGHDDASVGRSGRYAVALAGRLDPDVTIAPGLPPTASDAQRLAAAWERQGAAVLPRLRGAYAAVVTDGTRVWALRDHFGNRPLFHHHSARGWFIATEAKQVVAGAGMRREPDLEHLARVLFEGNPHSTALRGIGRIPRGQVATGTHDIAPTSTGYWEPERLLESDARPFEEAAEGLWYHLERACQRALSGADVLELSGGLDSTAIAGCIAGRPGVQAITTVYPEHPSADESVWSRMVADHLGMELHTFDSQAGSLEDLDRWVALADGPVEMVSIPEVAESYRRAAAVGGKTVLDGQIAEFILCTDAYLFDHLLTHGRWRALGSLVREHRAAGYPWDAVGRALRRTVVPPRIHRWRHHQRRAAGRVNLGPVPPWMDRDRMLGDADDELLPPHAELGPRHRWRRIQVRSLEGPAAGFEMDDILAAANGVEVRRPFADPELWEYVLSLRAEVRYADGRTKPLLREAMRGHLPDAVIDRTDKTVFDEAMLANADYPGLRTYLKDPVVDLPGIDYDLLMQRLEREDLDVKELQWARDLAKIHAFLLTF